MTASNRKPSGSSSSRSGHHSPGNAEAHRNLAPAGHLFGVGMGSSTGSKNPNATWQPWSSTSRNMPVAATESPQGGLRDSSWFGPQESQVALNQRTMRQRQASDNSATGFSQYSRYDSIAGKVDSRLSTSPTRHAFGTASPYSTQQPVLSTGSYDSSQVSAMVEGDLSVAMRGMAVEHENGLSQHPTAAQPQASSPNASRPGVLPQPQRPPFPAFPQPDYSAYYNAASHVDYTYSFDAYPTSETMYGSPALSAASPSLYPGIPAQGLQTHPPPAMRSPQSSTFFDYASSARPPSQYYYPAQAMMYHPPPPTSAPTGGGHLKRRSMQVSYQSPMMYPPVASPPSRPRSYHAGAGPMTMHGVFVHDTIRQQVSLQSQNGPGGRGRQREDVNAAFRSALLEEFRNSKDRKWVLKDIYGHVVEFSTDQHGSRFIQQKIETADEEEKQIIFDEIMPHHALRLIQDVFGNYVIQKFFEHGTPVQKALLAGTMEGNVLQLSLQMYGCRVVQKAIEHVSPDQQSTFVAELSGDVLRCVKDANGNHVIQRLIESVPPERLTFIAAFQGHVNDLATHPYGCRVLQRCFENLPDQQTRGLLGELQDHALHLMQDQFGNYVIQFVLEHGQLDDCANIVNRLRGQMLHMSRHKFASNVVEKALVMADTASRRALIDEIMTPRPDGSSPVVSMMKDQFANYVLQRALSVADNDQRDALIELVKPLLANMRKSAHHGRHLVAIERLISKCTPAASRERTPVPSETTMASAALATDTTVPASPQ